MALWRKMVLEGFGAHTEDVEPDHLEHPHLGKNEREPSSTLDESVLVGTARTMGVHLIPLLNLALAHGFLVSMIVI
ncbi:hypothetical protein KI387_016540, partial [Taxus chinensis]